MREQLLFPDHVPHFCLSVSTIPEHSEANRGIYDWNELTDILHGWCAQSLNFKNNKGSVSHRTPYNFDTLLKTRNSTVRHRLCGRSAKFFFGEVFNCQKNPGVPSLPFAGKYVKTLKGPVGSLVYTTQKPTLYAKIYYDILIVFVPFLDVNITTLFQKDVCFLKTNQQVGIKALHSIYFVQSIYL